MARLRLERDEARGGGSVGGAAHGAGQNLLPAGLLPYGWAPAVTLVFGPHS